MLQEPVAAESEKIEELCNVLVDTLKDKIPFTFEIYDISEYFRKWSQKWREKMPDKQSGVYIFRDPEQEIIYIGKATRNNLGAEIWGKFNASRVNTEGKKEFYQSSFLSENHYPDLPPETRQAILYGNIYFTIMTVDPPYVASLLEVYLQTVYQSEKGELPVLNRRIG